MLKSILTSLMTRSATVLLFLALSLSAHAVADEAAKRSINIPPQNLATALEQLSRQSGTDLVYRPEQVRGYSTHGLVGEFSPQEAVRKLLEGTPLTVSADSTGALLIAAPLTSGNPPGQPGASPQTPSSSPPTGDSLQLGQTNAEQAQGNASVEKQASKSDEEGQLQEFHPNIPEILIKGSRIMNVDVFRTKDDVQPYTIFDSQQIQQSGATNVEEFLKQQLTMNTVSQTASQGALSNNGTISAINLRGLGVGETLILIDGRRSAAVSINPGTNGFVGSQPDINGIPLSAVERIEVLPSSASAIYGGAAMGGVVNIILKRNFSGGDLSYTFDNVTSGNAPIKTLNGSVGFSAKSTGTQFFVSGEYSETTSLLLGDRQGLIERGIDQIELDDPAYYGAASPFPGATPNVAAAPAFDFANFPACATGPAGVLGCFTIPNLVLKNGTSLGSPITSVPAGLAPGTNPAAGLLQNAGRFNLNLSPGTGLYGLDSPFGVSPLMRSLYATIRQPITDEAQVFAEFSTNDNSGRATVNPFSSTAFAVSSASPINPFAQNVDVIFPTTTASGFSSDSTTHSVTVGAISPIGKGWHAELDYTWSRNAFSTASYQPDVIALEAAMNAGSINPFVDTLAHPLSLDSFLAPDDYSGSSTLNDLGLRASGPIPWPAAESATLTIGLEHRKEGVGNANYSSTFPLTPSEDSQEVFFGRSQSTSSAYAEALLPLVGSRQRDSGHPVLELQLAGRTEQYTVFNGTAYEILAPAYALSENPPQGVRTTAHYSSTNPTIGLKFEPVSDVLLRASYASAFLPPTASQLLLNPTPLCPSACILVTDPQTGRSYNVNITSGGNPNLQPQMSKTWDAGIVWEPHQESLHGLRLNLEYYKITQPNYIVSPTAQQVVGDPSLSSRVTRDPTTGLITMVDTSFLNATEYKTSGWDVSSDINRSLPFGVLGLHAAATFIKYDLRQFGLNSPFIDYAGFPNDGGEAKIKSNGTLKWSKAGWSLAWTTTYISSYRQVYSPGSPSLIQNPGTISAILLAQGSNSIPAQLYHDVYAGYEFGARRSASGCSTFGCGLLQNLFLEAGVKNVFNKLPPFDAAFTPYYYSPYGDPRLREYRITLRKSF